MILNWTQIQLFTTPEELRAIADGMEREWPKLKVGDSTRAHTIMDSERLVRIDFMVDQERMIPHD